MAAPVESDGSIPVRSRWRAAGWLVAVPLVAAGAGTWLEADVLDPQGLLVLQTGTAAVMLGLLALAGASLTREAVGERLGLVRGRIRGGGLVWICFGMLGLSHATEIGFELAGVPPSASLAWFADVLRGLPPLQLIVPLVGLSLLPAAGEELFFRGLLQRGMAPSLGPAAAIGIASVAFAAAHGEWVHGAAALVLGIYLGVVTQAADSLRPALLAHAVNNATAVIESWLGLELPDTPVALVVGMLLGLGVALLALRVALAPSRPASPEIAQSQK